MTTYIYVRVSTVDQNDEQQAQYLMSKYHHDHVVTERFTGTTIDRPEFSKLRAKLQRGDTLIVKEVSRLGRQTSEVLEFVEELKAKGVCLKVEQLGGLEVTSVAGEMILTMMAGLAKMEREQMLDRQRVGIARAQAEGKYKGRKAVDPEVIATAKAFLKQGMSKRKIAQQLKIGESTLYKYLAA